MGLSFVTSKCTELLFSILNYSSSLLTNNDIKASSYISENPSTKRRLTFYFEKGFLFVLFIALRPFQHLNVPT